MGLLIFSLLLFIQHTCCQENKLISWTDKVQDTNLVNRLLNRGSKIEWNQPDSSIYYFNKALLLSKRLHFTRGEFTALAHRAFPLALVRADSAAVSSAYSAIEIAENQKDKEQLSTAYMALGSVYIFTKDYPKAILYHRAALHYTILNTPTVDGTPLIMVAYEHLAECFLGLNQPDSAFFYIEKVLDYNKQQQEIYGYDIYLLGNVYFQKGNLDKALKQYREALAVVTKDNYKKDIANCITGIAAVFQKKNIPDSAIQYAKQALDVASRSGLINEKLEALNLLITLFESQSKIDSAFTYQKYALVLKDSIRNDDKVRQVQLIAFNEEMKRLQQAEQQRKRSNTLIIATLIIGLILSSIIAGVIYKHNQHRKKAYLLLQKQKEKTDMALKELKATQAQLIQSEKMASLGELTAGIAHEIQNPLNFVNNFSETNAELLEELNNEAAKGNLEEVKAIAVDLIANEQKINYHGRRADAIVKGMMQHARSNTGQKELAEINTLVEKYLHLAYHDFRAKDKNFNAAIQTSFDERIGKVNVVPQEIGRVLLNLFNNALYAVNEKKKHIAEGFEPKVIVSTKQGANKIEIIVQDNGTGIPKHVVDKIFQPFFTTKPTGEGTGLGLSLSYDIIKAQGGELKVESTENEGATFVVLIPLS